MCFRTRRLFSVLWLAATLATAPSLTAQNAGSRVRIHRDTRLDPNDTPTATFVHMLLGVPALTDVQRDTIEVLEQELRDTVALYGARMLRAQRGATAWWREHNVLQEREVNYILAARAKAMDRLRAMLTPEQQRRYDRNALHFRLWDIQFWNAFASGGVIIDYFDPLWEFP